jgi:hypothetical protein
MSSRHAPRDVRSDLRDSNLVLNSLVRGASVVALTQWRPHRSWASTGDESKSVSVDISLPQRQEAWAEEAAFQRSPTQRRIARRTSMIDTIAGAQSSVRIDDRGLVRDGKRGSLRACAGHPGRSRCVRQAGAGTRGRSHFETAALFVRGGRRVGGRRKAIFASGRTYRRVVVPRHGRFVL